MLYTFTFVLGTFVKFGYNFSTSTHGEVLQHLVIQCQGSLFKF